MPRHRSRARRAGRTKTSQTALPARRRAPYTAGGMNYTINRIHPIIFFLGQTLGIPHVRAMVDTHYERELERWHAHQ